MPPNLDIDKQPVSGVRKPYQQQQPPMAQPINMTQVPPMANPPIKEQPVYQPFTPPTQQSQNANGSFSTGMVWAILVLILCCNPIAIASIVLSAIAGGEFKRGDIENAKTHASLSKKITIAAVIISIIFSVIVSMIPTDNSSNDDNDLQQEEVEKDPVKEKLMKEALEKVNIEEKIKQNQSNNGVKLDIQPKSSDNKDVFEEFEKKKAELKKKKEEIEKSFEQQKNEFENSWEEQRKLRRSKQESQD